MLSGGGPLINYALEEGELESDSEISHRNGQRVTEKTSVEGQTLLKSKDTVPTLQKFPSHWEDKHERQAHWT